MNWQKKRIESERAIFNCAVSRSQVKRKKEASENAPQSKRQKQKKAELLKNTVQHEQHVNKQFNNNLTL